MSNKVQLKMNYKNTNFNRQLIIEEVPDSVLAAVEQKINSINDSLAAGTDNGLANFFISDDYNAESSIGSFSKISEAKIISVVETKIPLGGE